VRRWNARASSLAPVQECSASASGFEIPTLARGGEPSRPDRDGSADISRNGAPCSSCTRSGDDAHVRAVGSGTQGTGQAPAELTSPAR